MCPCLIRTHLDMSTFHRIYAVHDDVKDKDFELELSWVCAESKGKHQFVPTEIAQEAERLAKAALHQEMDED